MIIGILELFDVRDISDILSVSVCARLRHLDFHTFTISDFKSQTARLLELKNGG